MKVGNPHVISRCGKRFASRVEHCSVEAPWFRMPVDDEYSHVLGDPDAVVCAKAVMAVSRNVMRPINTLLPRYLLCFTIPPTYLGLSTTHPKITDLPNLFPGESHETLIGLLSERSDKETCIIADRLRSAKLTSTNHRC